MPELILHQYELSPFSEKARRIFALKQLPHRRVRAPAVMPKPDLVALTGGYRKIPVLQIGNHVYCDTALIARVLEGLAPSPTLYPTPVAEMVAEWADSALFETAVVVGMRPTRFDELMKLLQQDELAKMLEDRKAMRTDARKSGPPVKAAAGQLAVYLARLESALTSEAFLLGKAPSIADFSAYHLLWFLEKLAPEPLAGFGAVRTWMDRIASIPDAEHTPMDAEEALRICRESSAGFEPEGSFLVLNGVERGTRVAVRAIDYGRDPVEGSLVGSSANEVVVERSDTRAGTVYVHFPRLGYEVSGADK
jgi:glutathione S-transferase